MPLERLRRHADAAIALSIAAFMLVVSIGVPGWQAVERRFFDLFTVVTAPGEIRQPIVLVSINEEAVAAMNLRWPWPRRVFAEFVERVSRGGAAVIAVDVLFAEASTPEDDAALAASIGQAGNVVLAADFAYLESALAKVWKRTDPIPAFLANGALTGLAMIEFDPDQFVRRVPAEPDAFWRQIVKVLQVRAPSHPVPQLPAAGAMIRYLGPDSVFDPIPFHLVLQASQEELKTAFDGRIVIVGRDLRATPELGMAQSDLFATPFLTYSGSLTSGIKLHATIVDNALSGRTLRPLPAAGGILLQLVAAWLSFVLFRRWRPIAGGLALLLSICAFAGLAWYAFAYENIWIAIAAPAAIPMLAYLAYGAKAFFGERQRRAQIQRAFSHYAAPQVVERILADPSRLRLGGERREITVMFTDLAGFTRLTEKTAPDVISRLLIQHFTDMSDVIFETRGTIVQFNGDGLMAMWAAPLDDPEHALHAIEAAIKMQERMARWRVELGAQALPAVHMRIGVNTCEAVVGNMGSSTRFVYTAMGDGVNLASRLEGANKFYGTQILASGETVERLGGRVRMRRVDRVRVSGKTQPIDVFTPSDDAALVERSSAAFESYLEGRWQEAAALYRQLQAAHPDDGVIARLSERIEAWRLDPAKASDDRSVALDKL